MAKSLNNSNYGNVGKSTHGMTAMLDAAREGWQTTLRLALLVLVSRGIPAALALHILLTLKPS